MIKIKSKTQNGITLIALVVTIIVLLILAGVSINMVFSDGGILDKAKNAERRSTIAKEKEIVEMAYLAVSTEKAGGEITPDDLQAELENMVGVNKTFTTLDEDGYLLVRFLETGNEYNINEMGVGKTAEETFSEIATETKKYTDENGKTAIIPKGFAVGTSDTINKVDNGLVIQDKDGNQFVWIPAVGYVGNGFYIGRYEAGSEKERTEKTTENLTPLVQRDKFAYNYVDYNEAVSLCESMYSNLDSVEAHLPNGSDMNSVWKLYGLKSPNYNVSQEKGNFYEVSFSVTRGKYAIIGNNTTTPYSPVKEGESSLYQNVDGIFNKLENTQVIFTTGASDRNKIKNIYDIYGNVAEWNQESTKGPDASGSYVTFIGGSFILDGLSREKNIATQQQIEVQENAPEFNKVIHAGFRPVLYINESTYNF